MKLRNKFVFYNILSKVGIIVAIGLLLPHLIENVIYRHIDNRLTARTDRVLQMIERGGINEIIMEQDCSFESYNILKEEFVQIDPLYKPDTSVKYPLIQNEDILIENENLHHRVITDAFYYDNQLYTLRVGEGLSAITGLNNAIRKFIIWLTLILIILSIATDTIFTRVLLKPFHEIIRQKLRPEIDPGKYDFASLHSNTDEFVQLEKSINEMMLKIQDAFRIEKEFIANVSHELLTPISIVKMRLENILAFGKIAEDQNKKIVDSLITLDRMSKTVRGLLLISRIENNQFLKTDTVGLTDCVQEALYEMEDFIEQKKLMVSLNTMDTQLTLCSKTLIYNMLFNIINNACKYTGAGGQIIISQTSKEKSYELSVEDSGSGMNKEDLNNIFTRFTRTSDNRQEGFGLGLPIAKKIADFHGIKITVESKPGIGSKFTLHFPEPMVFA